MKNLFTETNIKSIKILKLYGPRCDDNDPLWEADVEVTLTDKSVHKVELNWVRAGTLRDLRRPNGRDSDREHLAETLNDALT